MDILEAEGLGKRFGRRWALADCTLTIPAGRVVGLVGPNGAGKTTLLHLAVGLLGPTSGRVAVLGGTPGDGPERLGRVGFVAQDTPTYATLSVGDHLRLGAWLNPNWDADLAQRRVEQLGLDHDQRTGRLSGGQRAQLASTLAVAKRPELLILDEPVASLDPLARRDFLRDLSDVVAERGMSVVFSSHLVDDVERVCDHLVVLVGSRVQASGDIDELVRSHRRLSGPTASAEGLPSGVHVVEADARRDGTTTLVARFDGPPGDPLDDPSWTSEPVELEDVVLAYMGAANGAASQAVRS